MKKETPKTLSKATDETGRQKISKDVEDFKQYYQPTWSNSHSQKITTAEYIFFSRTNGTFSKMSHMWGQKISLGKCQKTEIYRRYSLSTMELS